MVGSQIQGGGESSSSRSKEAVGMMALHEALRTVCLNSDWTYSVFWTIRPRPRIRGGNGCKVGDDNGSLMLMWEDGYCRGGGGGLEENNEGGGGGEDEDAVRKAFSKMSIQLYNYGEGLMGKVASDKCHKWVFKEPTECEPNISNYWQSSFDALPSEWTDQFESGIQTIAVIQAGHGLLQLGSCKIIAEDLHFVLRMRHTFESLGYQSGYYLSQLFSSTRNSASSTSIPSKASTIPIGPPPPLFNWAGAGQRPNNSMIPPPPLPPNFHNPVGPTRAGFPQHKDEHLFMLPSEPTRIEDMMMGGEHQHQHHPHPHHQHHNHDQHQQESSNDIKWPDGLSFFNALTGRTEDGKMLFNLENLGNKPHSSSGLDHEFLSLDNNANEGGRKVDNNKFKRSFTLPLRMASSSSAASVDHHHLHQQMEYRNSEAGMYTDAMDTYLE